MNIKGYIITDDCITCGICVGECPVEALKVEQCIQTDWAFLTAAEHIAAYPDEHPDMKTLNAVKAVAKIRDVSSFGQ